MKPFQGKITDWTIVKIAGEYRIQGIQRDSLMRTSRIVLLNIKEGYVETKNSLYILENPAEELGL